MTKDFKPARLCQATAADCHCELSEGHDGPHYCACGGAWTGSWEGGDFNPLRFPQFNVFSGKPITLF